MSRDESAILEREYVPKGTLILKQGDPGNSAYLIQSGRVEVFSEDEHGNRVHLAYLWVGQIIGEMALIFDETRTASVCASEDCNLIVLTRYSLDDKLSKTAPMIKAIMQMLTRRIVSANNSRVNRSCDIDDLADTVQIIYQNIHGSLVQSRKSDFQNEILPKLDVLLSALREFD
jgi:CRP-like cAMP-binding protein